MLCFNVLCDVLDKKLPPRITNYNISITVQQNPARFNSEFHHKKKSRIIAVRDSECLVYQFDQILAKNLTGLTDGLDKQGASADKGAIISASLGDLSGLVSL